MYKTLILKNEAPYLFTPYSFESDVGSGWTPLLIDTFRKIAEVYAKYNLSTESFTVLQIKEKYGALRIYVGGVPTEIFDEIFTIIDEAERLSTTICEICGMPGQLCSNLGWAKTLCDNHLKEVMEGY